MLTPEPEDTGDLFFIQIMTADKNGTPVENARNYVTIKVDGDAQLLGMDNGDSTDYEEYKPAEDAAQTGIHTRRLFANRLIAIVRAEKTAEGRGAFTLTAASQDLPNVTIKYDGTKWEQTSADSSLRPQKDFVPVRKIELQAQGVIKLDAANRQTLVTARVLPQNATIKEINWNPVFKECVASDNISVEAADSPDSRLIKAAGDGECILRCTAQNGTKYDEVISDLPFTISGIGSCRLNPYSLIEACRFTVWDQTEGKPKPEMSLESGISNRKCGNTWVSFEKVDFGPDGADVIHLPIFSFMTELPIEVWDGKGTGSDSICLGQFTYRHESIYNTYCENVFTINRRLFGIHTITIAIKADIYLHGFYFEKSPKAFAKLRALDANLVTGDSFTRTEEAVEKIGNNVNLDFADMDFGNQTATKLTICGKSNTSNNTINIKFFTPDGSSTTQVIEFTHTDDYEEKIFDITPVTGVKKISFVFLPGSNFDFKWFRFSIENPPVLL